MKILSPWCKVREKIGKKSVIFTDFDFYFFIFHGHKIEKKKKNNGVKFKNHGVKLKNHGV